MNPRPSSDESRIYPKISDDYAMLPSSPIAPQPSSESSKTPGCTTSTRTELRLFSLFKAILVIYFIMSRAWTDQTAQFACVFMLMEIGLLIGALLQDFCTMTLAFLLSLVITLFSILLICIVPITLTAYYSAFDNARTDFPSELKLSFITESFKKSFWTIRSSTDTRFVLGMEVGLSLQLILIAILLLGLKQTSLFARVFDEKLDSIKKRMEAAAEKKKHQRAMANLYEA